MEYANFSVRLQKHCFYLWHQQQISKDADVSKGPYPSEKKLAQFANVFRIDAKAKKEDLPGTFEGHVKHVEEVVTFLNHHEYKALESRGKRNTNGPNLTIPRATRQSFPLC